MPPTSYEIVVVEVPDVRRRHRDVLGEAAVAVHADDFRVRADVRVAGAAEQAASVDDVALRGHAIALVDVGDETADSHDVAGELVPDDDRRLDAPLRPVVPVVDVHVGAAHAGAPDANQDFVVADRRFGNDPSARNPVEPRPSQALSRVLCSVRVGWDVRRARYEDVAKALQATRTKRRTVGSTTEAHCTSERRSECCPAARSPSSRCRRADSSAP